MPETLPSAKLESQEKLCCGEIDIWHGRADYARMERDLDNDPGTLYLAEWLSAFGMKRRQLAESSGVSEPYVSQLANNKKVNPSREKLKQIAIALGITIKDLYSPPPPRDVIDAMRRLSPAASAKLQQRRRAS